MPKYFISRQRKSEIKDTVIGIFEKSGVSSLPVRLDNIVKAYDIRCIRMDKISTRTSSASDASSDGYIIKSGSKHIIVYNPEHSRARTRFTLACQLAHIFLGHLERGASDKATDTEANYFAQELLMPLSVLDSYGCRSAEDIAKRCDVSLTAAKIRAKDFVRRDKYKKLYGETEHDMRFLNCFFDNGRKGR